MLMLMLIADAYAYADVYADCDADCDTVADAGKNLIYHLLKGIVHNFFIFGQNSYFE